MENKLMDKIKISWIYKGETVGYHVTMNDDEIYFTYDARDRDLFIAEIKARLILNNGSLPMPIVKPPLPPPPSPKRFINIAKDEEHRIEMIILSDLICIAIINKIIDNRNPPTPIQK